MNSPDEEKELQAEINKLQDQIDQQKELVKKMIDFKRRKIQSETDKLTQLKSLVRQQGITENKQLKLMKKQILENLSESKVVKPSKTELKKAKTQSDTETVKTRQANQTHGHNNVIKFPGIESLSIQGKPNKFQRKILANRKNYYYKNRKFFHGYKFVLAKNDHKLCLMSASHELTGKPLENATMLPVYISLGGKNYIKSAKGDYYLENLSKKVRTQISTNTLPTNEHCIFFTKTGHCGNVNCLFQHTSGRVALCPSIQSLKHKCFNKICHFSHTPTQFNSPSCNFFQENNCHNENCVFTHKREVESAPICREFAYLGYCEQGLKCKFTHSFECPDVKEYGRCLRGRLCTCLHNSNIINGATVSQDHNGQKKTISEVRNKDNDRVIQVLYDDDKDFNVNNNDTDSSDDSDDNVEFIVGPVGQELAQNLDYVRL